MNIMNGINKLFPMSALYMPYMSIVLSNLCNLLCWALISLSMANTALFKA